MLSVLMMHEFSPQPTDQVRRGNLRQYERKFDANANARRNLYQYEKPPWQDREPYNIWDDMADWFQPATAEKIIDLGTNDSYFHRILRRKGFAGKFIGIDIEGNDLPAVEQIIKLADPEADVEFIQADAQNLRGVIESNSTPNAAALFFLYHAERPSLILSELHRILTPNGTGVISTRGITNQLDTWEFARETAHEFGFGFPQEIYRSYGRLKRRQLKQDYPTERIVAYSHFDIERLHQTLEGDNRFNVKFRRLQDGEEGNLWIPMTEAGIFDFENAVESLLDYTEHIETGESPTDDDIEIMRQYIQTVIRERVYRSAEENMAKYPRLSAPHYKSHASQAFFVVEAVK